MPTPMQKEGLADLDVRALAEALVTISREVRRAVAAGDQATIARAFDEVRSAADTAAGEQGLLLQVAEAFLRAMTNADLGVAEAALRRFVSAHGAQGTSVLTHAASTAGLSPAAQSQCDENVRAGLAELIKVGALRALKDGRLDVRPSLRGVVRDLVEPLAFRLWARVEEARAHAAYQPRSSHDTSAVIVASRIGVSERQASDHLRVHPLTLSHSVQSGGEPIKKVVPPRRYVRGVLDAGADALPSLVGAHRRTQQDGTSQVIVSDQSAN